MTAELPVMAGELGDAIRGEQAELGREILLWQRWVRYLALVVMVLLSLGFGPPIRSTLLPITVVAVLYLGVVMSTSLLLRRPEAPPSQRMSSLLLASDIVGLSSLFYLTSAPAQLDRILLLGFLVTLLGAFYFGRRQGLLAAALTIAAYVAFSLVAPELVLGPRPALATVAFDGLLFAILGSAVVHIFGGFRERIDSLRVYCMVVERGESMTPPPIPTDRLPDGLTLLARGFQAMHAHLAEQVGSDALTGCLNRRSFEMRLRTDLRQARRRGSTVAVAAVDLDSFKEINDSYGHAVGDIVLQQVAEIMKATVRDTDAVARYGGDEFVIVLPDTGWQGALTFADRLRRRVDDASFGPAGTPMGATISIGVALGRGTEGASPESLLRDADAALYRAKTAGRNRVFS